MNTPELPHCAGIVLAAGASSRMGRSKALLEFENGQKLVEKQVEILMAAGCDPVRVVTGFSSAGVIAFCGPRLCVENTEWKRGRVSSVVCGLRATHPFRGCIILPVDVAGIRLDTLKALISHAASDAMSIRPYYQGKRGNCCWISGRLYDPIMNLDTSGEEKARLDDLLRPLETRVDVDDPFVLNNINTPDDWDEFCAKEKGTE